MTGGHHVLEVVASRRHETLSFVLSVRTLEALHCQHNTLVFLCKKRAAKLFTGFSKHNLILLLIRKHDRVCQDEHTAGEVPHLISSRAVGRPLMADGHHVLEVVASRRNEMLGCLEYSDPRRPQWPTPIAHVSPAKESGRDVQRHLETQPCLRGYSEARPSVRRGLPRTKGDERSTCNFATFSPDSSARSCLFLCKDIERRTKCTKVHFRHFLSELFRQQVGTTNT